MKFASLTCPNCSGQIVKDGDKFVCASCGAAFVPDYDDADVEYEKLLTEEERSARDLEHKKELLETKYKLEEEAQLRREQRLKTEQRKKAVKKFISGRISALIVLAIFALIGYGSYKVMKSMVGNLDKFTDIAKKTEETKPDYEISADDLTDDFLTDAVSSSMKKFKNDRNEALNTYNDGWENYDPISVEYMGSWLITAEDGNRFVTIMKITYMRRENGNLSFYYDTRELRNITVTEGGSVTSDYVSHDPDKRGTIAGWPFNMYEDYDQCYLEQIKAFESDHKVTKVDYSPAETIINYETVNTAQE